MSTMPHHARRALTRAAGSLATLGLVLTVGCNADGATAPTGRAPSELRKEVVDPAVTAPVLQRSKSVRFDKKVQFRVDQRGGWFSIAEAGLYVYVPANAVKAPVTLSAQALRGDLMAYEFGPHGAKFDVPLQMYQDLDLARLSGNVDLSKFEVGYVADPRTLDYKRGNVKVNEFIPTRVVLEGRAVRFEVSHFSNYVIATGRGGRGKE